MKVRPDEKTIQPMVAAKKLTRAARREFHAAVTLDHCHGSRRLARELFPRTTLERRVVDGLENGSRMDKKHAVVRYRTERVYDKS